MADRVADFVNKIVYTFSDMGTICYAILYNRHICKNVDIWGSTFEKLATSMIQGMDDRDFWFYLRLYEYVTQNPDLKIQHPSLSVFELGDDKIETFLSINKKLEMSYEGVIVITSDLIRRRILIPDSYAAGRYGGTALSFGIGKYSKNFYDLFREADRIYQDQLLLIHG